MKRKFTRFFLVAVVLGVIGVLIWYYSRPTPLQVKVKPVEKGTVERSVANTRAGTVEACRRAKLSPSIGGQIAKLPIQEGDRVKTGSLLLELWNDDLRAEVFLAENETRAARARARSACLQAEEAQREANRLESLRKIGAAAEDKADQAVTQAKALKAECEGAKASAKMSTIYQSRNLG